MGTGDDMSEKIDLATRIAQASGIEPEKVCEVGQHYDFADQLARGGSAS
jgi:hypothetical protein